MALAKPTMWWPGIRRQDSSARGLLALWPFWAGAGSRAQDLVGRKNGALQNGAAWVSDTEGPALDFSSSGARVLVMTAALPVLGSTWLGRTKQLSMAATANVLTYGPTAAVGVTCLITTTGSFHARVETSAGSFDGRRTATGIVSTGRWIDWAITIQPGASASSDVAIWIDGVQLDTVDQTSSPIQTAGELRIGNRTSVSSPQRTSLLAVYDRVLSPSAIQTQHEQPFRLITPTSRTITVAAPAAAIMNQFQGSNLGADLFNGTLI